MKGGFSSALKRRLQRFYTDVGFKWLIEGIVPYAKDIRDRRSEHDLGTKTNVETFDDGSVRLTGTPTAKISHTVSTGFVQNITATRPFPALAYELDDTIGANPVVSKVELFLSRKVNGGQPTFDGFFVCQLYRMHRQGGYGSLGDFWQPQAVGAPVRVYAADMTADSALVPFIFDTTTTGRVVIDDTFIPKMPEFQNNALGGSLWRPPIFPIKQRMIVAVVTAFGGTNANYGLGVDTGQTKDKLVGGAGTLHHRTIRNPSTLSTTVELFPAWWNLQNPAPDSMIRATISLAAYNATGSLAFTGGQKLALPAGAQGVIKFRLKGETPTGTTLLGQARVAAIDPWVPFKDGQGPLDVGLAIPTPVAYEAQVLFTSPGSLDVSPTLRSVGVIDEVTTDLSDIAELTGLAESVDPFSGEVKMGDGKCIVQKTGLADRRDVVSRLMSENDFSNIEIRATLAHEDVAREDWLFANQYRVDDHQDVGTSIELIITDVLERLRGKQPQATGTILGYLLKAANSDLALGGADYTRELSEAQETPGSIVVSIAASATEDSYAATRANVPNILRWPTGSYVVKTNVSVGNANLQGSVALRRVNSAGVPQQTTAFSAEQQLTAGGKVFVLNGITWAAGNPTDRLVVIYRYRNTAGSIQAVTITTGDVNAEVDTPWTPNSSVQPKVYTAQTIQTAYLDWRDGVIGLAEQYRGAPPPADPDVITKSVMDTDGKRELERIAYLARGCPIASQGVVKWVDLQESRSAVVCAFPMDETENMDVSLGLRARVPEMTCGYGWGRNKPEEFQGTVKYQHFAALTKYDFSRIDNPTRSIEKEIAQWIPDQGLADLVTRPLIEALGCGFLHLKFNSVIPHPELDLGDTVAVETDRITTKDPVTGDAIKGPRWVLCKIIGKSGLWGQAFDAWAVKSYTSLYDLSFSASKRAPFEYPVVEITENSNTHAAGTASMRMRAYPDTATIKYAVHADGTAPPERESSTWLTYAAPVIVTRGSVADQLVSAFAVSNGIPGAVFTRRVAPVGVADISRPSIEAALKSSGLYQVTYRITARCPYGQQVKIKYRTVAIGSPSEDYASPAPTATALNNEPYATDVTLDRGMTDRWLECWAEDADGNSSFISRDRILAITSTDAENALTGLAVSTAFAQSVFPCTGAPATQWMRDTITWTNNTPYGVRLSWCTGTSCALPGTTLADPASSGFVNTVNSGVYNGSGGIGSPLVRSYRIHVVNSYGETIDDDDIINRSTNFGDC